MRSTERTLRRIIREELQQEGVFDDMMGRVRGMFGGDKAADPGRKGQPLRFADLIPMDPAIAKAGLKREDIARLENDPHGGRLDTKTYPASFSVGFNVNLDGVMTYHPFFVRGALVDQPALERFAGRDRWDPSAPVPLEDPRASRWVPARRLENETKIPKGVPTDAELKSLGVNMDMWAEYTRDFEPVKRNRRAKELLRAIIIVKALEIAFRILDNVYPNSGALFKPTGD